LSLIKVRHAVRIFLILGVEIHGPEHRKTTFTTIGRYFIGDAPCVKHFNFIFSHLPKNLAGPSFKDVMYAAFLLKSRFGYVDKFQVRLGLTPPNYRTFDGAADDVTRLRNKF